MIRRRELIKGGVAGIGALALGPAFWEGAMAASARPGPGPYGPLGPADANGLRLPPGFSSRLIAQGEVPVPGTAYVWHGASDGSATYALGDGGWILVSNSEIPGDVGGRGLGGRLGDPLPFRRLDRRRLPHPRGHEVQLLRRQDAVEHLAVV